MPGVGQPAPAFALPNQDGVTVASAELLARGPLIVSFFRGQW
jgi:peroxiredoxin